MSTLITPNTAAAVSPTFQLTANSYPILPATVIAHGLGAGETVNIEISGDGGTNWVVADTLTSGIPAKGLHAPGLYRVNKPVTAAACGVYLAR